MRRIDELFLLYPFYRSRQMVRDLRREGVRVGRHRVRRLMRLMGIAATCRARRGPGSLIRSTRSIPTCSGGFPLKVRIRSGART